jgi:hypothetical protein
LLDAAAADPLRATLGFEAEPPGFAAALAHCKPK